MVANSTVLNHFPNAFVCAVRHSPHEYQTLARLAELV